ncbi:MAG TPA: choice-of-anchor Q domain-containing protein [Armatimonadota bacterium]|jgi:hypothetical protein
MHPLPRWHRSLLSLALGCLAAARLPCGAAVIRVDYDAAGPSHDGAAWDTAFLTVQSGLDAAQSGDEVWVAAGVYAEHISLGSGVALYGGFAGPTASNPFGEQARGQRDPAVNLSILDGGGPKAPGSVVTAGPSVQTRAVIDGFSIRNGLGTPISAYGANGGGVYALEANVTISNNVIYGNFGTNGSAIFCHGGAVSITGNTLRDNSVIGPPPMPGMGGAIFSETDNVVITDNLISGNVVGYICGGVYCTGTGMVISRNTIRDNQARQAAGLYVDGVGVTIAGNLIFGNAALGTTSLGGFGGAGVCKGSGNLILNNTVTDNVAGNTVGAVGVGGLMVNGASTVANNIIAFNTMGITIDASVNLTHNDVFGNPFGDYGNQADQTGLNGNIRVDPGFANAYTNQRIQPSSPCVDAGDDAYALLAGPDLDGQARSYGAHADIGAFESHGVIWPDSSRVWRVAEGGDDSRSGLDWANAKATIASALAVATGGDEVWVAKGTYPGVLTPARGVGLYGGFAGSETSRDDRDIQRNVTVVTGGDSGRAIVANYRGIVVDGFTLHGLGGIGSTLGSITVSHNAFLTGGPRFDDIAVSVQSAVAAVSHNRIVGRSGPAIEAAGGIVVATDNLMADCSTAAYGASGTLVSGMGSVLTLRNNTIVRNASEGAAVSAIRCTVNLSNNLIAYNAAGVALYNSDAEIVDHCDVFANGSFDYKGIADPTGANGNIRVNPLLIVSPEGDSRLSPISPCVDAGNDAPVAAGETDLDGAPRIAGPRVDIGAYESHPATMLRVDRPAAPGASGQPLPPVTVRAVDAAGFPTPTYAGTATVALVPGSGSPGAVLSGTLTLPFTNGEAVFSDLVVDRSGVGYSLSATSGALAPGQSAPFNVALLGPIAIVKAVTPIVADGALSPAEWAGAPALLLGKAEQDLLPGKWTGPSDYSSVARVKWDSSALYFSIQVTDDVVSFPITPDAELYLRDDVEVFLGVGAPQDLNRQTYRPVGDCQVMVSADPGDSEALTARWYSFQAPGAIHGNTANVAALRTASGYVLEGAIPWALLPGGIVPAEGDRIGFNLQAGDNDQPGPSADSAFSLSGLPESYANPSRWITATLAPAPLGWPDVVRALRIAAGLSAATGADETRLDVGADGAGIGLVDAAVIARIAVPR